MTSIGKSPENIPTHDILARWVGLSWAAGALTRPLAEFTAEWAQAVVVAALRRIQTGQLIIKDLARNQTDEFGVSGQLSATLMLKDKALWWRVLLGSATVRRQECWIFHNREMTEHKRASQNLICWEKLIVQT